MLLYGDDENIAKVKELESAAIYQIPEHISETCARLGQVKLSARALGLACRFRGVDCVRALVEGGASFKTPRLRHDQKLFRAYSARENDFRHSDHSLYLLRIGERLKGSYCSKAMRYPSSVKVGRIRLTILPDSERARVLKYLCETKEKCAFDPSELLFYSIFAYDDFISGELKRLGIGLSEARIKALTEGGREVDHLWREYHAMIGALASEDLIVINERLSGELDGRKIRCTDNLFKELRSALTEPRFAEFFYDKFNTGCLNKSKLLREMIDKNSANLLPVVEKAGWLSDIKRRDSMIEYAAENGRPECTAWLLDFKNRTADLAAEREKAERKIERELNAAPDSVTALKALWSYGKLEDGTLIIKRYKGDQTEITVPERIGKSTVTVIGAYAFSSANKQSKPDRKNILEAIGSVTLPDTITAIRGYAFEGCKSLKSIRIPDSVIEIELNAFMCCHGLEHIKLPEKLSEIPALMLAECESLTEITIPSSVKAVHYGAFYGCGLKEIVVPDSVTEIHSSAFSKCVSLERAVLPKDLSGISHSLFYDCEKLRSINIPERVKIINDLAFHGCNELTEVVIPNGVTSISEGAFINCKKLKTVEIPSSVRQIRGTYLFFRNSPNAAAVVEQGSYAENYFKRNNIPYKYKEQQL